MNDELQRIDVDGFGADLNFPSIRVVATVTDAAASLEKVKEVIRFVATDFDAGTWSADDEWLQKLPMWFVKPFEGRTTEEVLADDTLWDFGSWLDAMRHRGWQWWSSTCERERWTATLVRNEDVYSIEPLIYLVRQSGASSVDVTENPLSTS